MTGVDGCRAPSSTFLAGRCTGRTDDNRRVFVPLPLDECVPVCVSSRPGQAVIENKQALIEMSRCVSRGNLDPAARRTDAPRPPARFVRAAIRAAPIAGALPRAARLHGDAGRRALGEGTLGYRSKARDAAEGRTGERSRTHSAQSDCLSPWPVLSAAWRQQLLKSAGVHRRFYGGFLKQRTCATDQLCWVKCPRL